MQENALAREAALHEQARTPTTCHCRPAISSVSQQGRQSELSQRLSGQKYNHPKAAAYMQVNASMAAAALLQPSSASNEQLAALKQQHEADRQRLEAEAASLGSRLAAAEASLTKAQLRETSLRESIVKHSIDMQQGAQRCAELQVCALQFCLIM